MRWALVLAVMCIGGIWNAHAQDCSRHSDGCSTAGLDIRYKEFFRPACYRHDVCYSCGVRFNFSKRSCDDAFLRDMKSLCDSGNVQDRNDCKKKASNLYRPGVGFFGGLFYNWKNPEPYCTESWVRSCLP